MVDLTADSGVFVSTTTPGPDHPRRSVRTVRFSAYSAAADFTRLIAQVEDRMLKIEVAERRLLTNLSAVHDEAAGRQLHGKTVLIPEGCPDLSAALSGAPSFCRRSLMGR